MTTAVRPSPVRLLVALAAALLAVGAWASPAAAHDGEAVVAVEQVHPEGLSVHYVVLVTWADDGHPATDATVTATAVSPDGTQLTPVTLSAVDAEGRYSGVVEFPSPGAWTLRVTSIEPTGAAEQAQDVAAVAPTPPPDEGGEATGEAGGDFAPADDDAEDAAAGTGDSDDGMPVYLIVAALAVVVIGAATAVNIIRRNRPGAGGGSAPGPSASAGSGGPAVATDAADTGAAGSEPAGATSAPAEDTGAGAPDTRTAGDETADAGAAGDDPSAGPPAGHA